MATIVGTNGNNTNLNGTAGIDYIFGLGGNDTLRGLGGNDQLFGDNQNDQLFGGAGNDLLRGAPATTALTAAAGLILPNTATPPSILRGPSLVFSPPGRQLASGVNLSLAGAQNTVGSGFDTLVSIENIIGTNFADILTGNALNNTLSGQGGNDTLNGLGGNDTLNEGDGNDILNGGSGNDSRDVGLRTTQ